MPSTVSKEAPIRYAEGMTKNSIRKYLSNWQVKLTVDKEITSSQIATIRSQLSSAIGVNPKGIRILKSNLNPDAKMESFDKKLKDSETEKRLLEKEKQSLSREKLSLELAKQGDDLKSRLEIKRAIDEAARLQMQKQNDEIKSKIEIKSASEAASRTELALRQEQVRANNLEKDLTAVRDQVKKLEEDLKNDNTGLGKIKRNLRGLELPATAIPLAIVGAIFLSIFFNFFFKTAQTRTEKISEGVRGIAEALSSAGKNMNKASSGAAGAQAEQLRKQSLQQAPLSEVPSSQSHEEVRFLMEEASKLWAQCTKHKYAVFSELKEWLEMGQEGIRRVACLISALPAEESLKVTEMFSRREKEAITNANLGTNSRQSGAHLVQEVQRKSLAFFGIWGEKINQIDGTGLWLASDEQLAEALLEADDETKACIFSILRKERFGRVLSAMTSINSNIDLRQAFRALAESRGLKEASTFNKVESWLASFSQRMHNLNHSTQSQNSEFILESMNYMSPQIKQQLQEVAMQHEHLRKNFEAHSLTMGHFVRLELETIAELFDPLEPAEIAVLLFSVDPSYQSRLTQVLSPRVIFNVQNEYGRLERNQSSRKKALSMGYELQQKLLDEVKRQAALGLIEIPKWQGEDMPAAPKGKAS